MSFDPDLARKYALRVWKYKEGEVVTRMIRVGDALGLYGALAAAGRVTAGELAAGLGYSERFVTEWLYSQAAAGLVEYENGEFWMLEEASPVLVNEDSLMFAGGVLAPPDTPESFALIVEAVRTGHGFAYADMGEGMVEDLDRSAGAWQRTFLPTVVLPQLTGMPQRLVAGGRVLEIGCGTGVALEALARIYPKSTFLGIDPSAAAATRASERLASLPNASVRVAAAEELRDDEGPFDLVVALDCIHDMARPDLVARRVRTTIAEDGVWMIRDIRAGATYEDNLHNPVLAMLYGFSVASCLPSSTSEPGGMALGTLGLDPETLRSIVEDAGFASLRILEADDPVHHYYEVRP